MPRPPGFSLLELVIAMGLTTAVLGSVFAMLHPAHGAFDTGIEVTDMQQRLRVAIETLTRDLTSAGSGANAAGQVGPLSQFVAPVLPYRQGLSGAALPGTFRSDTITLLSVPATAAQTSLAADLQPEETLIQATAAPGCPPGASLCGFAPGMTVMVYDDTGNFGLFTLANVADVAGQLTLTQRPPATAAITYRRGSNVVEARVDAYYLKVDTVAQTSQLMHGDGSSTGDAPVVDHLVALTFEYFGEPLAGEPGLTPLPLEMFGDGPWRPDDSSANRWDADLLRIRQVGVTLRIEAGSSALRGPAGLLFTNGGTSRRASAWVPDQAIHFGVSPRNLNLERP